MKERIYNEEIEKKKEMWKKQIIQGQEKNFLKLYLIVFER